MRIGIARITIGLLQGFALAALWPAFRYSGYGTDFGWSARCVVAPLALTLFFVPTVLNAGLGRLRPAVLAGWTAAAVVICAGVGLNIAYAGMFNFNAEITRASLELLVILLIGQSLLAARHDSRAQDGGYYQACFDAAWRHGLILALSALLTGVFWLVLVMGQFLFESAGSHLLWHLIREPYFWVPVTTAVFACALHITDARDGLTRGARMLALVLLSWLLPLMVVLVAGFLALLAVNGVETLWRTRWAAASMLLCAGLFIALINTVYRDGHEDHRAPSVLRYAAAVGTVLLVPLVALAGYAMFLRVHQYGWTEERVLAAVIAGIGACSAAGYLLGVLGAGLRMKLLERTNIVVALMVIGVLLLLNTPLADPVRLSVNSQMARLHANDVEPARFGFDYLARQAGRYGRQALQRLIETSANPEIVLLATRAAGAANRSSSASGSQLLPVEQRAGNITVVPAGSAPLPDSFMQINPADYPHWAFKQALNDCFSSGGSCHAIVLDQERHGMAGILLMSKIRVVLFTRDDAGVWRATAEVRNTHCSGVLDALRSGAVQLTPAQYPDFTAAGIQLRLEYPSIAACLRAAGDR